MRNSYINELNKNQLPLPVNRKKRWWFQCIYGTSKIHVVSSSDFRGRYTGNSPFAYIYKIILHWNYEKSIRNLWLVLIFSIGIYSKVFCEAWEISIKFFLKLVKKWGKSDPKFVIKARKTEDEKFRFLEVLIVASVGKQRHNWVESWEHRALMPYFVLKRNIFFFS